MIAARVPIIPTNKADRIILKLFTKSRTIKVKVSNIIKTGVIRSFSMIIRLLRVFLHI